MGWIGKAGTALAIATLCVAAGGTVQAQSTGPACKTNCNTTYSACTKRAINGDTCLRRWLVCKKKCQGRPATPPASAPPKR